MKIYLLHELIYDAICDICYDREYLYLSYISAFNENISIKRYVLNISSGEIIEEIEEGKL